MPVLDPTRTIVGGFNIVYQQKVEKLEGALVHVYYTTFTCIFAEKYVDVLSMFFIASNVIISWVSYLMTSDFSPFATMRAACSERTRVVQPAF